MPSIIVSEITKICERERECSLHIWSCPCDRQEKLSNWGFICQCDRCRKEESNDCDRKIYQRFDEIKKKAKKLNSVNKSGIDLDKHMLEIICYEEMYKLAKEEKVSWSFMIDHILDGAFDASIKGSFISNFDLISSEKRGFDPN